GGGSGDGLSGQISCGGRGRGCVVLARRRSRVVGAGDGGRRLGLGARGQSVPRRGGLRAAGRGRDILYVHRAGRGGLGTGRSGSRGRCRGGRSGAGGGRSGGGGLGGSGGGGRACRRLRRGRTDHGQHG